MTKCFIPLIFILLIMLFLTSCATEPLIRHTTSGYPEGIFRNSTVDEVRSKIIKGCSNSGLSVDILNINQVVCSKILTGKDAVIAGLVVGGQYSTPPERKIRFVIFQENNDVKVIANEWIESQSAYGQIKKQPLEANHQKNAIQKFLFLLGAE